jgi:type IV secretory pathway TraG/TraD family ATPase VirD4
MVCNALLRDRAVSLRAKGLYALMFSKPDLNQIEKAYGQNNSILDNCHVRVAFAANDERTAKRVSDALGVATELRAMKNYAGRRLSPSVILWCRGRRPRVRC